MNTARIDRSYVELVMKFPLVPLRRKPQFEAAVKIMKELAYRMDSLTSGEADYLSVLGDLIAHYEKQLPRLADEMTPQEALAYLMKANGLAQSELVEYVGHKSNLSAFLSGRRGLSKLSARKLADHFNVSPALFLPKQREA